MLFGSVPVTRDRIRRVRQERCAGVFEFGFRRFSFRGITNHGFGMYVNNGTWTGKRRTYERNAAVNTPDDPIAFGAVNF